MVLESFNKMMFSVGFASLCQCQKCVARTTRCRQSSKECRAWREEGIWQRSNCEFGCFMHHCNLSVILTRSAKRFNHVVRMFKCHISAYLRAYLVHHLHGMAINWRSIPEQLDSQWKRFFPALPAPIALQPTRRMATGDGANRGWRRMESNDEDVLRRSPVLICTLLAHGLLNGRVLGVDQDDGSGGGSATQLFGLCRGQVWFAAGIFHLDEGVHSRGTIGAADGTASFCREENCGENLVGEANGWSRRIHSCNRFGCRRAAFGPISCGSATSGTAQKGQFGIGHVILGSTCCREPFSRRKSALT